MSHYSKPSYRNINPPVPDSDSDKQEPPSPQSISSPPSPSSAELSSDPAVFVNQSVSSHSSNPVNLDLVFPSTAVEFNLTRPHTNPTVPSSKQTEDQTVTPLTTNPVFIPSRSRPVTTHTMPPNYTGVNALPIQGKRDAPRTFKGSYDKVEEFLKTMDKLFARYEVTSDNERVDAILPYCSTKVQDFIRTSPAFTKPNWDRLKKHMMEYYDAE